MSIAPTHFGTVEEYLARGPALPHLVELAPARLPGHTGSLSDVPELAAAVRAGAEPGSDVRLLVAGGAAGHRDLAGALAESLSCDVYLAPEGADVRCAREDSPLGGDSWDVIVIDRATGRPVDWVVVRPPDVPPAVPTWFVSARGRLRPRAGLVTIPLPDGIAFATRASFRDMVGQSARLRAQHARVTTLAVNADQGRFEIGRFEVGRFDSGAVEIGGAEFASLVTASLDVIHPDVQAALTWPRTTEGCATLDAELAALAAGLNRTVWVPEPAGAAAVLPGVGELAAVDEVGSPASWRAYPPRPEIDGRAADRREADRREAHGREAHGREAHGREAHGREADRREADRREADGREGDRRRYRSDLDGRLALGRDVVVTAFPGAPLVSVPSAQLEQLREWYDSIAPCAGLFAIDLAVLGDGRLGVCQAGGDPLAVGPRELRERLARAGWAGEDLLLLAQPPAQSWNAMVSHAWHLLASLTIDIWLAAPGAEVWVRPDGTLDAEGPDGAELAWRVLRYGRPGDDGTGVPLPPALSTLSTPSRAEAPPPQAPPPQAPPPQARARWADLPGAPAPPAGRAPVPEKLAPPAGPAPASERAAPIPPAKPAGAHGVAWLPSAPVVNPRPIEVYLAVTGPRHPDDRGAVGGDECGVVSPDLFLLAGQDPLRLAEMCRAGSLLRVRAAAQSAIDLYEHSPHAPEAVRRRLDLTGCTHLLPLSWLAGVRVTASFPVDGDGGIGSRRAVDGAALAVRFAGADHAVVGLPNEVVRWPDRRLRTDAPTYLLLSDDPFGDESSGREMRLLAERGCLALSRRRPTLADGHRLLEVKVRRRSAIDVPATRDKLTGLAAARLPDLAGLDLLLAEPEFASAVVTTTWRSGHRRRPVVDRLDGATLAGVLAAAF